jgi:CubicO group peptidase (beta-lactamase class C family)
MTIAAVSPERLDALLTDLVDSGDVPHVVALAAANDGELYRFARGPKTLGHDAPMTPDTVIWLASMTKLIVSVGALQQLERGVLQLDAPLADVLPALGAVCVLEGFDANGEAVTRLPRRPITLRHLLTHTAGYAYSAWNPNLLRYEQTYEVPPIFECRERSLLSPLMFDPGTAWEYGTNIDWVGKAVEQTSGQDLESYVRDHVLDPLGMTRTSFVLDERMRSAQAGLYTRGADGRIEPLDFEVNQDREFYMSGGGMYGSTADYLRLLRALLNLGTLDGVQVLQPETVIDAARNHIGDITIGPMTTLDPGSSNDVTLMPRMGEKWSLLGLVNEYSEPNGRSRGSMFWCGMANCYYWVDWNHGDTGLLCTQVLPFVDPAVVNAFDSFERTVHDLSA